MSSTLFLALALALRASAAVCPSLPTCPNDNECTFSSNGADFEVSCATDFLGGDLRRVYAATVTDCMKICASTDGCVALSYVGTDCYLKNTLNAGVTNTGVTGAKIISRVTLPPSSSPSAGPQQPCPTSISCPDDNGCLASDSTSGRSFTLACGVDFYGGDLQTEWTNGLGACSTACAGNPQCIAASFVGNGDSSGPCYLKNKNLGPVPDSRVNGFSVNSPILSSPSASTPTISIIPTSPPISTPSTASSTLATVTSPAPIVDPQCADRSIRLCCLNIAPWSSNSAVWGGICGYTPSTGPSELVGARCISRPASGQCPAGSMQACCKGTWPGQCALGTQCARV